MLLSVYNVHTAGVATLTTCSPVPRGAGGRVRRGEGTGGCVPRQAHGGGAATLVVRSAQGLYPVVDPGDIVRGGFDVLAVRAPPGGRGDQLNSVITARKVDARVNGL